MRPWRYVLADWRQQWWGLVLLVPFLVACLACVPFLWAYEVVSDWWLDLIDVPDRNSHSHVARPYSSYEGRGDMGVVWGTGALKRRNLRAWCRDNRMPFEQCEASVKAYFAEDGRRKNMIRRYWKAGGGRVMHEDSSEAAALWREAGAYRKREA